MEDERAGGVAACPPSGQGLGEHRGCGSREWVAAKHGGRGRGGAGRRRLCVVRQIRDEVVPCLEQFLLVDDVVAVKDGAALVPGEECPDLTVDL